MSHAGTRALLDRAESAERFRDLLLAAGSVEERRRLVLEAGHDIEPSDLPAFREMVGSGKLSDEDRSSSAWIDCLAAPSPTFARSAATV